MGWNSNTGFSWVCDGSHVYSVETTYEIKQYTGDFAEIDPTYAFATITTDFQTATSAPALHFVWPWGDSSVGWYYGTEWEVKNKPYTFKGSKVKLLIDIHPK